MPKPSDKPKPGIVWNPPEGGDIEQQLIAALAPIIKLLSALPAEVAQSLPSPKPLTARQPLGISPDAAARMLGISTTTFYEKVMPLVYGGAIESVKIGRRRIILVESLTTWLEEKARSEQRGA